MMRFILFCFFYFLTSNVSVGAQQDKIIEVIPLDDVKLFLNALFNSGYNAAEHVAEFAPLKGDFKGISSNLQGTVSHGMDGVFGAIGQGASGGVGLMKSFSKQIPVFGALMSSPTINTVNQLKTGPIPTLVPATIPEDAARASANFGIASETAKNSIAAVSSVPAETIAHGARTVSNAFNTWSNKILMMPSEINQLLEFQHGLLSSFFAGAQEADTALPPEQLRNEIMALTKIQPHLKPLLDHFTNPVSFSTLNRLSKSFTGLKSIGVTTEDSDLSAVDPVSLKLALANVALSFLESASSAQPRIEH